MVEQQPSKLKTRVRFPSPALVGPLVGVRNGVAGVGVADGSLGVRREIVDLGFWSGRIFG
jgi:hypothetical protein